MNLSFTFPILETSATALCGTTGILPIDVGWLKKKTKKKQLKNGGKRNVLYVFWLGYGLVPGSVSLLFHISLPHLFWKALAEPFLMNALSWASGLCSMIMVIPRWWFQMLLRIFTTMYTYNIYLWK